MTLIVIDSRSFLSWMIFKQKHLSDDASCLYATKQKASVVLRHSLNAVDHAGQLKRPGVEGLGKL